MTDTPHEGFPGVELQKALGIWPRPHIGLMRTRPLPDEKLCRSCREIKKLDAFWYRSDSRTKTRSDCKDCERERAARNHERRKEQR